MTVSNLPVRTAPAPPRPSSDASSDAARAPHRAQQEVPSITVASIAPRQSDVGTARDAETSEAAPDARDNAGLQESASAGTFRVSWLQRMVAAAARIRSADTPHPADEAGPALPGARLPLQLSRDLWPLLPLRHRDAADVGAGQPVPGSARQPKFKPLDPKHPGATLHLRPSGESFSAEDVTQAQFERSFHRLFPGLPDDVQPTDVHVQAYRLRRTADGTPVGITRSFQAPLFDLYKASVAGKRSPFEASPDLDLVAYIRSPNAHRFSQEEANRKIKTLLKDTTPETFRAQLRAQVGQTLPLNQAYTIYGADLSPPAAGLSAKARAQYADAYVSRVRHQLAQVEAPGTDAQKNLRFIQLRPFTEPSGYFSGGLLAAGIDPNQNITVRVDTYFHIPKDRLESSQTRTYRAWEIAAGALAHDRPGSPGLLRRSQLVIDKEDMPQTAQLEAIGRRLQAGWERDVDGPGRQVDGALARRSGQADAYTVKAVLRNLRDDRLAAQKLSPQARGAIERTLTQNGQVIIPNIYGYPLSGYAFVPFQPYDGHWQQRPNAGLMIDLRQQTVSQIDGDDDFAAWAGRNQDELNRRFNARDIQGGRDEHWPRAGDVLAHLIKGEVTYPGFSSPVADEKVPVRALFNYTRARSGDYGLKFGALEGKSGIADHYAAVNAGNLRWSDQTEVFGASQQRWKQAGDIWNSSFAFVPLVGNAGNIVFGIHDGIHGKTAQDRNGGNVQAVVAGLQLAHELATTVVAETGAASAARPAGAKASPWVDEGHTLRYAPPPEASELPPASERPQRVPSAQGDGAAGTVAPSAPPQPPPPPPPLRPQAVEAPVGPLSTAAIPTADPLAPYVRGNEVIENARLSESGLDRGIHHAADGRRYLSLQDAAGQPSRVVEAVPVGKGLWQLHRDGEAGGPFVRFDARQGRWDVVDVEFGPLPKGKWDTSPTVEFAPHKHAPKIHRNFNATPFPQRWDANTHVNADAIGDAIASRYGIQVSRMEVVTTNGRDLAGRMGIPYDEVDARANPAAWTSPDGKIYIAYDSPDYVVEGRLDVDKIRSTVVHEYVHAASKDHVGLQAATRDHGQTGLSGTNYDEAIVDYFAHELYAGLYPGRPYKSGYFLAEGSLWMGELVRFLAASNVMSIEHTRAALFRDPGVFRHMPPAVEAEWQRWVKSGPRLAARGRALGGHRSG